MRAGKGFAMYLHLVDAEQLRAQRRRIGGEPLAGAVGMERRPEPEQAPDKGVPCRLHLRKSSRQLGGHLLIRNRANHGLDSEHGRSNWSWLRREDQMTRLSSDRSEERR